MTFLEWRNKIGTADAYHWCKAVILDQKPARFYVDAGGIGAAVLSLLRNDEDIPKAVVRGVNFGARSQAKMAKPEAPGPKNRRAEMWKRSKDWLEDPDEPVSIFDVDKLQADATAPRLKKNLTNDILLESKEDMRARGIRSPDLWDSFVLTFASNVLIKTWNEPSDPVAYGNPDKKSKYRTETLVPDMPGSSNGWMC